jgi:methylisocitrate lyase
MVLYPLSASRAMSAAARDTYAALRRDGTQKALLDRMQTRAELYDVLGYVPPGAKPDAQPSPQRARA